ncbi:MAG TPA: hypothetical protein VIB79_04200 [Candidatus Binatia bacterium]
MPFRPIGLDAEMEGGQSRSNFVAIGPPRKLAVWLLYVAALAGSGFLIYHQGRLGVLDPIVETFQRRGRISALLYPAVLWSLMGTAFLIFRTCMWARYRPFVPFDLLRTVESAYANVFCCPGALTAYRAKAVRAVLDAWRQQTFLGVRCTFGEDRALTNIFSQPVTTRCINGPPWCGPSSR